MRAKQIERWLSAFVEAAGDDPFDREVLAHIVRVWQLAEVAPHRELEIELGRCIKVMHARSMEAGGLRC